MSKYLYKIFILLCFIGCKESYDDSSLWNDVDHIYNELDLLKLKISSINDQMSFMEQIVNKSAITAIEKDANNNYIISYKDADNVEQTIVIATKDDVLKDAIIGVKEENGVWYWTQTVNGTTSFIKDTDGSKIPVDGRTPSLSIDKSGYWVINGVQVKDASGNPVKADVKEASLITGVSQKDDTVEFTLGDGSVFTASMFNAFNILFDVQTQTLVTDAAAPFVVNYQLTGEKSAQAIIDIKANACKAVLDKTAKTITVTFDAPLEKASLMIMLYDLNEDVLIKPLYFVSSLEPETTGISTAEDLVAFAAAVNSGASISRFRDPVSGAVVLNNDIDMSTVTDWTPIGNATLSTTSANASVTYTNGNVFNEVFDGKGYAVKNIQWTYTVSDDQRVFGLFGALGVGAVVRNLNIGTASTSDKLTIKGTASQGLAVGAVAGYVQEAVIENCKNYTDISFEATDAANVSVRIGGIAGVVSAATVGGDEASLGCVNFGHITGGAVANVGAGSNSAIHSGGIAGLTQGTSVVKYCVNKGDQSIPSGRGGGIIGTVNGGEISNVTNDGFIQDDVNNTFASNSSRYNVKRMGGLVGGIASSGTLKNSVNNGNVFSQNGSRTGGFVGHNEGVVDACCNTGIILSDHTASGTNLHGSAWACGYNKNDAGIVNCIIGGKVGNYTDYQANPTSTPDANYSNAVRHGKFVPMDNGLSHTDAEYYDWSSVDGPVSLANGVTYTEYSFKNIAQHIFVVEADWTNPNVEITTAMADDMAPNPNNNNNVNNGKNLRETLSEVCARRRSQGQNIVAGINTGFFDSNAGIPRGFHIEEGEAVYINNPQVRASLVNHKPGFTVFEDRTISFENRDFKGLLKVGSTEYEYYSVNDTILRSGSSKYDANLYTYRLKHYPHTGVEVKVGSKALLIVGKNSSSMKVNKGYVDAKIVSILDGRDGSAIEIPYLTDKDEWVLQVTGDKANELKTALSVGASVQIRTDVTIGGSAEKAIYTHNSSMYRFLYNGTWGNIGMTDEKMPATVAGLSQDGKKVYWVAVDGRSDASIGLTYYELYRTCQKLGAYNMIRFDGGGSTTMWIYRDAAGKVVNQPCDTNGERSCMNYFQLRVKE